MTHACFFLVIKNSDARPFFFRWFWRGIHFDLQTLFVYGLEVASHCLQLLNIAFAYTCGTLMDLKK